MRKIVAKCRFGCVVKCDNTLGYQKSIDLILVWHLNATNCERSKFSLSINERLPSVCVYAPRSKRHELKHEK